MAENKSVRDGYRNKMKNKLFGLLCEREKGGEWEKFLDMILTQLMGYSEAERGINYYFLFYKLSACRYLEYEYFRRNIFECMNLFGSC